MKFKIIQGATLDIGEWKDLINIGSSYLSEYLKKHSYEYDLYNISSLEKLNNRPASWSKIQILKQEIEKNLNIDYFLWLDADTLIINQNMQLTDILKNRDSLIHLSKDSNGINFGIFLIRNCRESLDILDLIWSKTSYVTHQWWEQAALMEIIANNELNIRNKISYIEGTLLNSYDEDYYGKCINPTNEKSLFMHCPGQNISSTKKILYNNIKKYYTKNID